MTTDSRPPDLIDYLEWRWIDDKGRAMTKWKSGNPPPVLDLEDSRGTMSVEVRVRAISEEAEDD